MSDLSKGYTFSGTSPNNNVTAEKLNALVDQAAIQTGFYTERAEVNTAGDGDYLLLYHSASGTFRRIRKGNLVTSGVAGTTFSNLAISNNIASPKTRLEVSADEIVVRSTSGLARHITSFARIVDIESYGGAPVPDGRDFPTEMADTWYYLWAISNGAEDRLLLSSSRTSPTLPAEYNFRALLGAVRNDHAKDFVPFTQRDRQVALQIASKATVNSPFLNPTTGNAAAEFTSVSCDVLHSFQPVSLSQCVPPGIVASVSGIIGQTGSINGIPYLYAVASRASGDLSGNNSPEEAVGLQILPAYAAASTTPMFGFYTCASFHVPLASSQTLHWAASTGTGGHSMRINGYTLAL